MSNRYSKVSIGKVIREATSFDPKKWGKPGITSESIPLVLSALFELLEARKISYVLVGGIAMLSYVQGRNTSDLDLIIALSDLDKLPEIEISHSEPPFARGNYQGLQIDFLFTIHPLFSLVSTRYAQPREYQERTINTATVEGLLLLKLYALPSLYRQGDYTRVGLYENDIAVLLQVFKPDHTQLIRVLSNYLGLADFSEVESILKEILGRLDRFNSAH
jgi:hypothetical protein